MFSGMGVGFIINHEIYRGAHCAAGEVRQFLSETKWGRIIRSAASRYNKTPKVLAEKCGNFRSALECAEKGDEIGVYMLREASKEISSHLIDMVNLFDPEIIIIGGDICEAEKIIGQSIIDRVNKGIISNIVRNVPIKFSSFGTYSGAVGGAALIYRNIFSLN
jgi:predicted NBD/HSP70 family sugar kinase